MPVTHHHVLRRALLAMVAIVAIGCGGDTSQETVALIPPVSIDRAVESEPSVAAPVWGSDARAAFQGEAVTLWNATVTWNEQVAANERAAAAASKAQPSSGGGSGSSSGGGGSPTPGYVGMGPCQSGGYVGGWGPGTCNGYACGGNLPPCCVMAGESGGNPLAENPTSTASGLWQVLDSTWNGYGDYGHAASAPVSVQQAQAAMLFAGGSGAGHWAATIGCAG